MSVTEAELTAAAVAWQGHGCRPGTRTARLNNYLDPAQRAAARKLARRRMARYTGVDRAACGRVVEVSDLFWWRGGRLQLAIEAQPRVFAQLKADLFGAFASSATAGDLPGLWRMSPLVHSQALQRAHGLIDKMSPDMLLARVVDGDPLYESTTARGTVHVKRAGKPFADFELESEDQWAEALATNNPTGMLDEAPAGALRILCICTMGFATGVKLRSRAEKILDRWGVEAWFEARGVIEAIERVGLADVVLVTRDEEAVVRSLSAAPQRVIAVENSLDPAEIRRALAKDPAVIAQRLGTT